MLHYESTNKIDWFIDKLRSGWFSRQELLDCAQSEFADVSKTNLSCREVWVRTGRIA
jgi:hypothetical protein